MASAEDGPGREAADDRVVVGSIGSKLGRWAILTLLLAVAAGGSWYALRELQRPSSAAIGPPAPPTVTVATPLRRELVEWDEFTGRFEAVEQVEVRARVAGYLDAAHFQDGQMVEEGQLLFTIDQRSYANAVADAEGALVAAEAALVQARQVEERQDRLRETGSPAFQRSVFEDLGQARVIAQGQAARARAQLAAARLNFEFTTVRAPVGGRISSRRLDVGSLVGDATLLTTIVSLDPIYFTFDMSESDFLAYQRAVGSGNLPSTRDRATVANVNLEDEADWPREGHMDFVDNVVDPGAGTVRARVVLANADLLIAPGQFGRVRIPGSPLYPAILVPESAILTEQSQRLVMLVGADNRVVQQPVRVGPREGGLRIIRRGLDGSERVVINGFGQATPGSEVVPEAGRIEPETTPPAGS